MSDNSVSWQPRPLERDDTEHHGPFHAAHAECMRLLVTVATGVGGAYENPEYLLLMFRWVSGMSRSDARQFFAGRDAASEDIRSCLWAMVCTHTASEGGQLTCAQLQLHRRLEHVGAFLQASSAAGLLAAAVRIEHQLLEQLDPYRYWSTLPEESQLRAG